MTSKQSANACYIYLITIFLYGKVVLLHVAVDMNTHKNKIMIFSLLEATPQNWLSDVMSQGLVSRS